MQKTIGCIGCGNMGAALLYGFAGKLNPENWRLCGYNRSKAKMKPLKNAGIEEMADIKSICQAADLLIFAVKPAQMPEVLNLAREWIKKDCLVISIAAGYQLAHIRNLLGGECKIARCMPTTTALAGRGVFAFCYDPLNFEREEQLQLIELFNTIGYCVELSESKITDFSALIGAGPAYLFETMQGLLQAGVTLGFNQVECAKMVTELVAGTAALAAQENKTYMQLRDQVCSPAGLTIAGINTLDRAGYIGILVECVMSAKKRSLEMEANQ